MTVNGIQDELQDLRSEMDALDASLVALLCDRARLVQVIRTFKEQSNLPFHDPQREEKILARALAARTGPITEEGLRNILRCILLNVKPGRAKEAC